MIRCFGDFLPLTQSLCLLNDVLSNFASFFFYVNNALTQSSIRFFIYLNMTRKFINDLYDILYEKKY